MFKLIVLKEIRYRNFDKISTIKRYNNTKNKNGMLYVNDIITVDTKEEADYLCGNNDLKLTVCGIVVEPTTAKKTTKKKGDK
jgi:hypothetical protein